MANPFSVVVKGVDCSVDVVWIYIQLGENFHACLVCMAFSTIVVCKTFRVFFGKLKKSHSYRIRDLLGEDPIDIIVQVDLIVHHERTIHGSGGNSSSDNWRHLGDSLSYAGHC